MPVIGPVFLQTDLGRLSRLSLGARPMSLAGEVGIGVVSLVIGVVRT
jgi:hypothetical protein